MLPLHTFGPALAMFSMLNTAMPTYAKTTTYPTKSEIKDKFALLNGDEPLSFYELNVAQDVKWTLMGTHPLAGVYNNLTIFLFDSVGRLDYTIDHSKPTSFEVTRIVGGGNEEWSVQELHGTATCKNGIILLDSGVPGRSVHGVLQAADVAYCRPDLRQHVLLGHPMEH